MKLAKEIGKYVAIKAFPAIASLIIIPIIYRNLGSDVYGSYSIIQSFALLIITFSSALTTQPVYRFYGGEKQNKHKFIRLSVLSALLALIWCLVSAPLLGFSSSKIIIAAALVVTGTLYSSFIVILQVDSGPKGVAKAEIFRTILYFCGVASVGAGIITGYADEDLLLTIFFLSFAFVSIWLYLQVASFQHEPIKTTSLWLSEKVKYGLLTALWLFICGLPWFINRWLAGDVYGLADTGNYSSVHDLTYKAIGMVASAVSMAIFPALSAMYHANDYDGINATLKRAKLIYYLFSVSALLGAILFGQIAFKLVLGLSIDKSSILSILLGILLWQFGALHHKKLELIKRIDLMLIFAFISLVIHMAILYILIQYLNVFLSTGVASIFSGISYILLVSWANPELEKYSESMPND